MKLHSLQYLRAIAATAVVWSHAAIQVDSYKPFLSETGAFGVDIFFVISGFIMVYIAKETDSPRRFFVNRVRRVIPLYWFFTLLMAAILLLMPSVFKNSAFSLDATLKSLFFIPETSISNPEHIWPILAPGWSLNYEMYFYGLFALALFAPLRWRIWIITAAITVIFLIANLSGSQGPIAVFYSSSIVFEFVFGMVLALLFRRFSDFKMPTAIPWLLLAAGFAIMLLPESNLPRIIHYGIPALMIVIGTIYCTIGFSKFFVMLGDTSYSLYICHIFTLGICRKILPAFLGEGQSAAIVFAIVSTIICIIVAIAVHYIIDDWLLRTQRITQAKNILGSTKQTSKTVKKPA